MIKSARLFDKDSQTIRASIAWTSAQSKSVFSDSELSLLGSLMGPSLEQSVRDDLAVIKGSPLVRKQLADRTYGFVYDIKTGLVSPLED